MRVATMLASRWWGYAEADRTIVGVLVATVAALAVIYVIVRVVRARQAVSRARSRNRAGSKKAGSRG